jgi:hypothetical protein
MTAAECRLKAEDLEQLARIVSYKLDRDKFTAQALVWREKEAAALAVEFKSPPSIS